MNTIKSEVKKNVKKMGMHSSQNGQSNVEKLDNLNYSSETIQSEHIKQTPFTIITIDGKSFGTIGAHRITEQFDSIEDAVNETKQITWDRIVQVIWAISEKINLIKQENE